jgi:DNA-binding transcriptional ArsR family regulator
MFARVSSAEPRDLRDPREIRALAHPLRLRLLDALRFEGPETATGLARRLGESSGSTSYHLRQLARHGFVEEQPGLARGRERWWRPVPRRVRVGGEGLGAEALEASAELVAQVVAHDLGAVERFVARRDEPEVWRDAAFSARRALLLTPDELSLLDERIRGVLDEARPAGSADAPAGARPVELIVYGVPFVPEEPR